MLREPVKRVEDICRDGCDLAADLLANSSAWISCGQHQRLVVACIVVRVQARYVEHPRTAQCSGTVGCLSSSSEFSASEGSIEMISDRRSDANGKVWSKDSKGYSVAAGSVHHSRASQG
jgi:hypothetical protein